MEAFTTMTNGELMAICLVVFAAVLIFPRLLQRRRIAKQILESKKLGKMLTPEDFQGKQRLFYTHNGRASEIEELLVKVKTYAFKRGMKIVFPGNIHYQDQISPTTMILVGSFGLLLIRCYGFGGHIYLDETGEKFLQNMNKTIREIPSPIQSMFHEKALLRQALNQTDFQTTPIYTASVFTRSGTILSVPEAALVFDRSGFLSWLKTSPRFACDNQVETARLAELLVKMVKKKEV